MGLIKTSKYYSKKYRSPRITLKMLEKERARLCALLAPIEEEISKRTLIGYRGFRHGDEYNFGSYQNFLFSEYGRSEAKRQCKEYVEKAENGGSMQELHKGDDLKYGVVH